MFVTRHPAILTRDAACFAFAVLVHLLLLWLPVKHVRERFEVPSSLSVQLRPWLPPVTQRQTAEPVSGFRPVPQTGHEEPLRETVTNPFPRRLPRVDTTQPLPERQAGEPVDSEALPRKPDSSSLPSRQNILQSLQGSGYAEDLTQGKDGTEGRNLGDKPVYRMPRNWERNAGAEYLSRSANTFDGMTAPEEVEIVDRWIAADGSHRVVVNLPNGETVCGRAEPYNPMQPLVEPVMMFSPCGGGGKRSFSMPERYQRNR